MDIRDLTLRQIEELRTLMGHSEAGGQTSFRVGTAYLIRACTYHVVGRITSITATDLVMENASWVADSGRWNNALKTGTLNEVEPFVSPVIVSRGAIVDATEWTHALPEAVK